MDDQLLTVQEAAEFLRVAPGWVYRHLRGPDGVPHLKVGKYVRFSRERLEEYIERLPCAPDRQGRAGRN